jgi:ceramide glucosyltransferase
MLSPVAGGGILNVVMPESMSIWVLAPISASVISIGYILLATLRVAAFRRALRSPIPRSALPPVTVLKPIRGLDAELAENLRSFCEQDYPKYQVIFGVHDENDPAIPVIREVIADHPRRDLSLVIDEDMVGVNLKASNLANMCRDANYDVVVVADSDMRAKSDYLAAVVAPFEDPNVGAVTCLYTGTALDGLPSVLGAMFINDWFLPSALVAARTFPDVRFCLGATIAVRRRVLEKIGGFEALSQYLADDYMLGRRVRELGLKVRLASRTVENVVLEPDFRTLWLHELRWARTIRTLQPLGFGFSFITDAIPLSILFSGPVYLATGSVSVPMLLCGGALVARVLLHLTVKSVLKIDRSTSVWWIPLRDFFTFGVRAASFLGRNVHWRRREMIVDADGRLAPIARRRELDAA